MTEPAEISGEKHRAPNETFASSTTGLAYPVEALVRDDNAGARAFWVTRHLIRLVSEFDVMSYAAVNIRTGSEPSRLEVTLELHGDAARDVTKADLESALGEGVFLGDPTPVAAASPQETMTAYELVRTAVAPVLRSPEGEEFSRLEWALHSNATEGAGFAAPLPNENDSAEPLLAAMARSDQQIWVRTVLKAADDLAAQIVVDELNATMSRQGLADYARVPIMARTTVVSSTGVPVAVRAALRQRGNGLQLKHVDPAEVLPMWSDPLVALRFAAVGETHAVAITRIPTAGAMRSLGVATRHRGVPERPLDPMPQAPTRPIRLGWATDAFGRTIAVEIDASDLVRHYYIEGQSGSGKTLTLAQLFWSITRAGCQVIYLDAHGDGAARAAAYSSTLEKTTTRYIRHGDREHPVRMNPLAEFDSEALERVLSALLDLIQKMLDPNQEGYVGERFKRTFTLVAHSACELFGPRTSITNVLALVLTKESLQALARAVKPTSPDTAARLEAELISLGEREFAELISWFVSRLQPFLRTPALREILGTGEDAVDMLEVFESGTNLIIDLASLELGDDVARVLGALWLLKVRSAMGRRTDRSRPIVLLVDEAHLYTFGALPGLLAEARKFGIGVVVATQAADNLAPMLARAIEANCGSAISLRTGITAAGAASERLGGWPPRQLTRLEDLTAAASLSRGGVPTQAFTLHIDHLDVVAGEGWDQTTIPNAAAKVAKASNELLWGPFADRKVLNDAEVFSAVKRAHTAQLRANLPPKPTRTASLLDDWMQRRGEDRTSDQDEQFDVVLESVGTKLLEVVMVIRKLTGMGLAEAKQATERSGSVLVTSRREEEAQALVERLNIAGATARVVHTTPTPAGGDQ